MEFLTRDDAPKDGVAINYNISEIYRLSKFYNGRMRTSYNHYHPDESKITQIIRAVEDKGNVNFSKEGKSITLILEENYSEECLDKLAKKRFLDLNCGELENIWGVEHENSFKTCIVELYCPKCNKIIISDF
mgnify:CR=1 FL=1